MILFVIEYVYNSFMSVFVQTNKATKSIILNCSEIVINDIQFKGKDQCEFVYFCIFCVLIVIHCVP